MARSRTPSVALQPRCLPLHAIQDAAGLGQDRARSSAVSPWPNSFWNTARGLPSCGSDCVGVRHDRRAPTCDVVSSSDGSRVSWPMCFTASWSAVMPAFGFADGVIPRLHAAEPRRLDVAVRLRRLAWLVAQARHDGQVLPQRLERLQDRRHVEGGAGLRRGPLVHDGAVREPDERQSRRRLAGRRLRPCRGAGFIASRSGSAIVAPTPFNTVRREMCFRDRYMSSLRPGFRLQPT